MRSALFSILIIPVLACGNAAGEPVRTSKDCDPNSRTYFPVEDSQSRGGGLDAFDCEHFSRHLRAMNEPSLLHRSAANDARLYRLLLLPTFGEPVVMRLEKITNGRWRLVEKVNDGKGGYAPGKMIFHEERILTKSEARRFETAMAALDLQRLKTDILPDIIASGTISTDGEWFVFEAVHRQRYRVLSRPRNPKWLEPELDRLAKTFESMSAYLRRKRASAERSR